MSRRARVRARVAQRGTTSVLFALSLTALCGLLAIVIDAGHGLEVRSQLQNAADAAALAGVLDLNGSAAQLPVARAAAQTYGLANAADGTAVTVPAGDVVLGNWSVATRTFSPLISPASQVNAVRVTTRRTAATGDAVETFFARVFGVDHEDVIATAVAVGGGPAVTCGFPLALPDCSLFDAAGNLNCDGPLTFNSGSNNVAFTLLSLTNPNTPDLECAFARALSFPTCPKKCDCSNSCLSSTSGSRLTISNGNNFSTDMMTYIQWAVANTPGGLYVQAPVISTGISGGCQGYALSGDQTVAGYVELHITGATSSPNKSVVSAVDCARTTASLPGGGFFGYRATKVYVGQ